MWGFHYVSSAGAERKGAQSSLFLSPFLDEVWRCSVWPQASCRSAAGLLCPSAPQPHRRSQAFPRRVSLHKEKGKVESFFRMKGWGLLFISASVHFLFFSCSILMEELNISFLFFFFLVSHWESFKQLVSFFNLQARILKIYGLFKGIKEEVSWYKPIKLHWLCILLLGLSDAWLFLGSWRQPAWAFLTWNLSAWSPASLERWKCIHFSWTELIPFSWLSGSECLVPCTCFVAAVCSKFWNRAQVCKARWC